jgi:hypothetical protein
MRVLSPVLSARDVCPVCPVLSAPPIQPRRKKIAGTRDVAIERHFAEQVSASHATGYAVILAGHGRVAEMYAGHCHGWNSRDGRCKLPKLPGSISQYCIACPAMWRHFIPGFSG